MPFDDDTFDIATSNAVLEHVGSLENQLFFVHELCRVARRVFIVVPNRFFPIEHHTALPIVHYQDEFFQNSVPDYWKIGMGVRRKSHLDDAETTLAACCANQKEGGRWLYWFIARTIFVQFVSRISLDSVARSSALACANLLQTIRIRTKELFGSKNPPLNYVDEFMKVDRFIS